jgi:hypothetical protein
MIDTIPTFSKVVDAAKFHRPENIPTSLEYNFTSFNY